MLDKTNAQKVQVEERINGTMVITYEGSRLRYREITERPEKEHKKPNYVDFQKEEASYLCNESSHRGGLSQ